MHPSTSSIWRFPDKFATILALTLVSQSLIITTIICNPIEQRQGEGQKNVDVDSKKAHDLVVSPSNDRKPSRLDANENELMHIDELSSPSQLRQQSQSSEQIMSPQIDDAQVHPSIVNSETFQPNDLVNLLDLQEQHQQNRDQAESDESFANELNANAKRRARSISEGFGTGSEFLGAGSDFTELNANNAEFDPNDLEDDSSASLANANLNAGDNDSSPMSSNLINVDPAQRELEVQATVQADLINKLAMEDQQRKQNEIQTAQAQHVARAIEDQQAALTRQHDILMKQQLDEALNDSDNDRLWRKSLRDGSSHRSPPADESSSASTDIGSQSDSIFFSDNNSSPPRNQASSRKAARKAASDQGDESDDEPTSFSSPAEASNWSENYDLAPAAQNHNYGSNYGALHKHQGKYYQSVESHKKGQYKSGFKRGNKKFTISGHAMQHKSHASGHVKWHSKKGKGSHHWDLKHKDHKKKHHHY